MNGYTINETDPLRSAIKVSAKVSTIQTSLHIKMASYNVLGQEFYMQQGDVTLPSPVNLLVQSIVGLNNFAVPDFKPPVGLTAGKQLSASADCAKYGARQSLTR